MHQGIKTRQHQHQDAIWWGCAFKFVRFTGQLRPSVSFVHRQGSRSILFKSSLRSVVLTIALSQLAGCDTPAVALRPDVRNPSALENPIRALQMNEKLEEIKVRDEKIASLLAASDRAIADMNWDQAELFFVELQTFDPGNLRAREGLSLVANERRYEILIAETRQILQQPSTLRRAEVLELAKAKLHPVILESPRHPLALPLFQDILAEDAKLSLEKPVKKLAYNKPISMEFRDANIRQVFESLSKITKINFILDRDIPPDLRASIFVRDMVFNDALDLLLQSNGLDKKILGENAMLVFGDDAKHQREYKELMVRTYVLDFADAKQISTVLKSTLGLKTIEMDARLNALIIKDSPEMLMMAEKIIYAQDKPDPEVMLEMRVMEVTKTFNQQLGATPPTQLTVPSSSGSLTIGDLKQVGVNELVIAAPGAVFSLTDGNVNLLANPRIRVKNKEVAKIHIGEKVPVFTANVSSTGVSTQSIQYIDAGLKLELEPTIYSTDDISIKINLNVGSIGAEVTAGTGSSQSKANRVGTRLASTQLRLHDGETQVLAGLIDDQDKKTLSGISGLAKLPILGKLFGNTSDVKSKTEIVLSITPHIVRTRQPYAAHEAQMETGAESKLGNKAKAPVFENGANPFMMPRAPRKESRSNAGGNESEANKPINIPLPPGFSLGNGLSGSEALTKQPESDFKN